MTARLFASILAAVAMLGSLPLWWYLHHKYEVRQTPAPAAVSPAPAVAEPVAERPAELPATSTIATPDGPAESLSAPDSQSTTPPEPEPFAQAEPVSDETPVGSQLDTEMDAPEPSAPVEPAEATTPASLDETTASASEVATPVESPAAEPETNGPAAPASAD